MANTKYNYENTPFLSKVKIGGTPYFLKDAEARNVIDSILADYLKSGDKTELLNKITTLTDRVETIEGTYATDADLANAIAKEVEDRNAAIADEALLRKNADDDLDARIDAIEASAVKVKSGEKIIGLNDSTHELSSTLSIAIEKKGNVDYIVLKGIGGAEVASVDASAFVKDGMIESVELVKKTVEGKEHTFLKITFNTEAGKSPIELDVTTLIDVYTAGKGLELAGNQFSVKIDEDSEDFLSVSVNGVKLEGVQDAINLAAGTAEQNAKTYADGLNSAMDLRVKAFEANGAHDVAALEGRVTTAEGNISTLQTKVTTIEGKPAYNITDTQISNWDNEVGTKASLATEVSERKAADTAINNKIGSSTDASSANTVYGAIKKEAEDRAAADATNLQAAKDYADDQDEVLEGKINTELAKKVDKVEGSSLMTEAEHTKLAGIEAGAQVNKIESIKLNGAVKDIVNKQVDLGNIATSADLNVLETRVGTAEGEIDTLQGQMAVVQGADTVEGSIAKAKKDAINTATSNAKTYTDAEVGALQSEFDAHTHEVTASGKITPSLNVTPKYLTATASGAAVSTENSDEFIKTVDKTTQGLAVAQYVNGVTTESKSVSNWTITPDSSDAECLVFTSADVSWYGVQGGAAGISKANAATGSLSTSTGLAQVVTDLSGITKGTAVGSVSISAQPSIALNIAAGTSEGAVKYVEAVVGKEQDVNVSGTAAKVSK